METIPGMGGHVDKVWRQKQNDRCGLVMKHSWLEGWVIGNGGKMEC